jgi:hypothetical protein
MRTTPDKEITQVEKEERREFSMRHVMKDKSGYTSRVKCHENVCCMELENSLFQI